MQTDGEAEEKATAIKVANARLESIYHDFEVSNLLFKPVYFS